LAPEKDFRLPINIKLKNALYGNQSVRVDFTVEADERLEFSIYRNLSVGTQDIALDVRSYLDRDGVLVVEQMMTNLSGRLSDFKCHLRSFGRQPKRMHVYRLGQQRDRKVYRIPEGRDLLGREMLLEIEEVNGPRMLNYRFVAGAPNGVNDHDSEAESDDTGTEAERQTDSLRPMARTGS
jgi:hypothetical protein